MTVIATGIGSSEIIPGRRKLTALRGRLRDIIPSDKENVIDYEEPAFIRKQVKADAASVPVSDMDGSFKINIQDEDDLDVPTFLRRKAD